MAMATREAYGKALVELGRQNQRLVVLDADLSKSTKTSLFASEFPQRFFNMGIAEQNLITTAAGLALGGLTPFASTFAVFAAGRALEMIRNSIAYPRLNVKIAATHAGLTVGEDGASHQAIEDIALMRALPNMTVVVPADAWETEQAVYRAAELEGPVYLRLGRTETPDLSRPGHPFEIGRGMVLQTGRDATIIACGIMVAPALKAAFILAEEGLGVGVINMATIKPLDTELVVAAARQTGALVTAEEHSVIGGLGSSVAEVTAQKCPVPLEMVGVRDTFGESGKPAELLRKYGLTEDELVAAVRRVIKRKQA